MNVVRIGHWLAVMADLAVVGGFRVVTCQVRHELLFERHAPAAD